MPGVELGIVHRDAVSIDELRAGQQRVGINIGLTAWTFIVSPCSCAPGRCRQAARENEAQDQQHRIDRGTAGQPDPYADGAEAVRNANP